MAACLRFKVPNGNLEPGSWPTETGDGLSAMTDPWTDNEGEGVECHAKSEREREAWSVHPPQWRYGGRVERGKNEKAEARMQNLEVQQFQQVAQSTLEARWACAAVA
jgi:hypothetical protein